MAEKTKVCDACGEEWEEDFFCEICSRGGEYRIEEVPDLMWDGYPGRDYVEEETWVPNGDICLNCCGGHTKPNTASTGHAHALEGAAVSDDDCPF